jgi:GNAT superfamily N-acetyltransferase
MIAMLALIIANRGDLTSYLPRANMEYEFSTDIGRLDISLIHGFLSNDSTWARGISRSLVERSIQNSLCFGLYAAGCQIGFARVITDKSTFAHLVDVFVVPQERGRGLSRKLVEFVLEHPDLQGLRRFTLTSSTAPWLYEKLGWTALRSPHIFMERYDPDVYTKPGNQ